MIPRERIATTMNLEEPDRVPVMCQMSYGFMLLQTGFSPSEFWLSAELFTEGLLKLRKIYSFDGILISLHGHSPHWQKNQGWLELTYYQNILVLIKEIRGKFI